MVSADNLHLDILELIFTRLGGNDLVSISLVSRSFLAGVIPKLYHTLSFYARQAKRYPTLLSPFSSVLAHPLLAVHVRNIEIKAVPLLKGEIHPVFIRDCAAALKASRNLTSFTCTENNVLPLLLLDLLARDSDRIKCICVHANLTADQSKMLMRMNGLRSLALQQASWNAVDMLPKWVVSLKDNLTHLAIDFSFHLNEIVLEATLSQLPNLLGLHIVSCPKIEHQILLRQLSHVPRLESLSFTTWDSPRTDPATYAHLSHLRHLSLDTRCSLSVASVPALWTGIFTSLCPRFPGLISLSLKLSERMIVTDSFLDGLLDLHGHSLVRLTFTNASLSVDCVRMVCDGCPVLETLGIILNDKDLDLEDLADALAESSTLHTLINSGDSVKTHGPRLSLSRGNVFHMMDTVPTLRRIVSDNRDWIGTNRTYGVHLSLEKLRPATPPGLSFMAHC